MKLEYDPVAEDFLLIEGSRIVGREYVDRDDSDGALALLQRLRRTVRKSDLSRTSLDKPRPIEVDETQVRRFNPKGYPVLDLSGLDLDLDLEL